MSNYLSKKALKIGDVLLCYNGSIKSISSRVIYFATGSKYSHAAIYIGKGLVAEAVFPHVRKNSINRLLANYSHLAAFRQPDAWIAKNQQSLLRFVDSCIKNQASYNLRGIPRFVSRRRRHHANLQRNLTAYFAGLIAPVSTMKKGYFCSEFVADCFAHIGFVDESAQVLYRSDVTSPGDLGEDPTYGTFAGYISRRRGYVVPADDQFFNHTTYHEIFGTSISI